ncbi:sensor histidine kinase [Bifidobacterium choloepi]|nr:histidine kinase [Bifidobacterium choloepi]
MATTDTTQATGTSAASTVPPTRFTRLVGWFRRRPLVADTFGALSLFAVCGLMSDSTMVGPGLLFHVGATGMLLWTVALCLPFAARRRWPRLAAIAFIVVAALQIVLGPALLPADFVALPMLFSSIVYGHRRRARGYVAAAFVLVVLDAAALTSSETLGPLLAWNDPSIMRHLLAMGMTSEEANATLYTAFCSGLLDGSMRAADCTYPWRATFLLYLALMAAVVGFVCVLGFWHRARRRTVEALRERNAALVARDREAAEVAAEAERARIARDMHDVVAHTLSIIIVQSDGGRYAGVDDVAVARSTMETIRHEAGRALADMQRLLGVFSDDRPRGDDDRGTAGGKRRGYRDIPALVAENRLPRRMRTMTVRRVVDGTPRPDRLSGAAGEAAYRLVQESLTNARKYAGAGAHVVVSETWAPTSLTIDVTDDGQGAAAALDGHRAGYGLIGMRERVGAVGGSVAAGPGAAGGFRVRGSFPLDSGDRQPGATSAGQRTAAGAVAAIADDSAGDNDGRKSRTGRFVAAVERVSLACQRHYVAIDVATALLLLAVFGATSPFFSFDGVDVAVPLRVLFSAPFVLPLAIRRRFPQSCAAIVAIWSALSLCCIPYLPSCCFLVVVAVYSVSLYGPPSAKRWIWTAVVVDSLLFGARCATELLGVRTLAGLLAGGLPADASATMNDAVIGAVEFTATAFLWCAIAILFGSWRRVGETNARVLAAREQALVEEQRQRAKTAANDERRRIANEIREDVTGTLGRVVDEADAALAMVDDDPTPERISAAFADIGREGRAALARMRELLAVLRTTGRSDVDNSDDSSAGDRHEQPRLRPAASLDEQLRNRPRGTTVGENTGDEEGSREHHDHE